MIDKAIYSYWSKPYFNRVEYGFNNEKDFINCLKLSLHHTKKHFSKVELITDDGGEDFLVNNFGLEFDIVRKDLNQLKNLDLTYWSLGKILACKIQKEPFLHIDNDVILFKKPPKNFLKGDACFQSLDWVKRTTWFDRIIKFNRVFNSEKPIWYNENRVKHTTGYNCGLIGFNNLKILDEWYDAAMGYIEFHSNFLTMEKLEFNYLENILQPNNNDLWQVLKYYDIDFGNCVFFEQFYIYKLCEYYGYDVKLLTDGYKNLNTETIPNNLKDGPMIPDDLAEELGYVHLIGGAKRKRNINEVIEKLLDKIKYENY